MIILFLCWQVTLSNNLLDKQGIDYIIDVGLSEIKFAHFWLWWRNFSRKEVFYDMQVRLVQPYMLCTLWCNSIWRLGNNLFLFSNNFVRYKIFDFGKDKIFPNCIEIGRSRYCQLFIDTFTRKFEEFLLY